MYRYLFLLVVGLVSVFGFSQTYSEAFSFDITNTTSNDIMDELVYVKVPKTGVSFNSNFSNFIISADCQQTETFPAYSDEDFFTNPDSIIIWFRVESIPSQGFQQFFLLTDGDVNSTVDNSDFDAVFPVANREILTNNQVLLDTLDAEYIEIPAPISVTLTAENSAALRAKKIRINGTVNGDNLGFSGGAPGDVGGGPEFSFGIPPVYQGTGYVGCAFACPAGGGGSGGYGGAGGDGSGSITCSSGGLNCPLPDPMSGGTAFGSPNAPDGAAPLTFVNMGPGGAGAEQVGGGAGGGAITFFADIISLGALASINVNGQQGDPYLATDGPGGAGAGGGVAFVSDITVAEGSVNAEGGPGNDFGSGSGGGGRVKVFVSQDETNSGFVSVDMTQISVIAGDVSAFDSPGLPGGNGTKEVIPRPFENAKSSNFKPAGSDIDLSIDTKDMTDDPIIICLNQSLDINASIGTLTDYQLIVQKDKGAGVYDSIVFTATMGSGTDPMFLDAITFDDLDIVGIYVLANAAGCPAKSPIYNISIVNGQTVALSGPDFVCEGNQADFSSGGLFGSFTSNPAGIIDLGNSGQFPVTAAPGDYEVAFTFTDPNCGAITDLQQFSIIQSPLFVDNGGGFLEIISGKQTGLCPFEEVQVKVNLAYLGDVEDLQFNWMGTQPISSQTSDINNLVFTFSESIARTLSLTVSANGCTDGTVATLLLDYITLPIPIIDSTGIICSNIETDTIKVDFFLDGVQVADRQGIFEGRGILPQNDVEGVYTPEIAGEGLDTVIFTYSEGTCIVSDTQVFEVKIPNTIGLAIDIPAEICFNSPPLSAKFEVLGGVWEGRGIVNEFSGLYDPDSAGLGTDTIYYTVKNSCDQFETFSKDTRIINFPDATINQIPAQCSDALPFELNSINVGGIWSGEGVTNSSGVYSPSTVGPGTYTVFYTLESADGCIGIDSATINILGLPFISLGEDIRTCDDSAAITLGNIPVANGGSGGFRYQWEPFFLFDDGQDTIANPTTKQIDGVTDFTLQVTDKAGCMSRKSVTVSVFPEVKAEAGNNIILCENELVTKLLGGNPSAFGGIAPFTYSWSPSTNLSNPNIANPTLDKLGVQEYTLSVRDGNGCKAMDTINISTLQVPQFKLDNQNIRICRGDSAELAKNVIVDGSSPFTYSWSPSQFLNSSDILNPTAKTVLTTNFTLTVTDLNGCVQTDQIKVVVDSAIQIGFEPLPILGICADESIQFQLLNDYSERVGPVQYAWSPSIGLNDSSIASPTVNIDSTIQYTLTVTDLIGCSATDSIKLIVNPALEVDIDTEAGFCNGESAQLGSLNPAQNGTAPFSYQWLPNVNLNNNKLPNPRVVALLEDAAEYTLNVIDSKGCTSQEVVRVFETENPVVSAGADKQLCKGESITIGGNPTATGNGPFSYSWSEGSTLSNPSSSNPQASPLFNTRYFVEVSDAFGCSSIDEIVINVVPKPSIEIESLIEACFEEQLRIPFELIGNSDGSFEWLPSSETVSLTDQFVDIMPSKSKTYTLSASNEFGCFATQTVNVNVNPTPSGSFDVRRSDDGGYIFTASSSQASGFVWNFGQSGIQYGEEVKVYFPENLTNKTVCLTLLSPENCENEICENINLSTVSTTHILSDLEIFPNPTQSILNFSSMVQSVKVRDISSRILIEKMDVNSIDLSSFATGQYLIEIIDKHGISLVELIQKL